MCDPYRSFLPDVADRICLAAGGVVSIAFDNVGAAALTRNFLELPAQTYLKAGFGAVR
jgi:hypothetical protein